MPDDPVSAQTLRDAAGARWDRYVADHIAARDTVDAAITQVNARLTAATDPTKRSSLRTKRDDLIIKRTQVAQKFAAANAGEGRIKAPTAAEVAEHKARATEVANATADSMSATALVQTATKVASQFARLHLV
jgi:hypothetical protein